MSGTADDGGRGGTHSPIHGVLTHTTPEATLCCHDLSHPNAAHPRVSVVDFTFLTQTKAHYQTEAQLANFLGPFLGMVETVNFLTRTLISSRLITRYGLRVSLLVHPIVLMGCSVLLAVTGTTAGMSLLFFWLTALTKLCDEVLWKSIDDPVFLILYQPLPAQQRFTVQIAMQGIMGPLAVALSGAILVLFGTMDSANLGQLSIVTLVVLAGVVVVVLKVQREYAGA